MLIKAVLLLSLSIILVFSAPTKLLRQKRQLVGPGVSLGKTLESYLFPLRFSLIQEFWETLPVELLAHKVLLPARVFLNHQHHQQQHHQTDADEHVVIGEVALYAVGLDNS